MPTKTTHERTAELRMQFPVSSGQQHRKTETEWVAIPQKKTENKQTAAFSIIKPVSVEEKPTTTTPAPAESAPAAATPGPQVFPNSSAEVERLFVLWLKMGFLESLLIFF